MAAPDPAQALAAARHAAISAPPGSARQQQAVASILKHVDADPAHALAAALEAVRYAAPGSILKQQAEAKLTELKSPRAIENFMRLLQP